MGPAATADFYAKLIANTPAQRDQDHLPVVIWTDPQTPDRSAFLLGQGPNPTSWLKNGIEALVQSGCRILAVPCNTAHAFVPDLAKKAGIQLISIVDVTAEMISKQGITSVGLLATTGTVHSGIYTTAIRHRGIVTITPSDAQQEEVMAAIQSVKAGTAGPEAAEVLTKVTASLTSRGAQAVVAGCTEIVLALDNSETPIPVIDPSELLARSVVDAALGNSGRTFLAPEVLSSPAEVGHHP